MSSSRLVRGAKTRMFAIVCLICVLGAVVFVFHGTQSKLAEVQKLVNSCNQQQESLSAQLQGTTLFLYYIFSFKQIGFNAVLFTIFYV